MSFEDGCANWTFKTLTGFAIQIQTAEGLNFQFGNMARIDSNVSAFRYTVHERVSFEIILMEITFC